MWLLQRAGEADCEGSTRQGDRTVLSSSYVDQLDSCFDRLYFLRIDPNGKSCAALARSLRVAMLASVAHAAETARGPAPQLDKPSPHARRKSKNARRSRSRRRSRSHSRTQQRSPLQTLTTSFVARQTSLSLLHTLTNIAFSFK